MNTPSFSSSDLPQLQRQLDTWRRRQKGRPHLPGALWDAAAQLSQEQGVSRVARTLRIDFYKLQRRVQSPSSASRRLLATASSGFVELKLDATIPRPGSGGVVELCDGPQRRLRLETGHDPTLWLALAEAFWRSRP
jgi:hypothetical protein